MPFKQDCLIVSSPNNGGMSLVEGGKVSVLDRHDTTGFLLTTDTLYRNVIVENTESKTMQLQSFSAAFGKHVLINDEQFDFHDILLHKDILYLASTGSNEVISMSMGGDVIKRYVYPGHNDSWHINCLSVWDDRVVLSAFGEFDSFRGYKGYSRQQGFVADLETGNKLWEKLSQPHTPIQQDGCCFVCNSEEKQVLVRDKDGKVKCLQFDGYTRGLAFGREHLYVGLSASRNIAVSEGATAQIVALNRISLEKTSEISLPFSEIYDISVIEPTKTLALLMLSLNGFEMDKTLQSINLKNKQLEMRLTQLNTQFRRVNSHIVTGPILRLLKWIKRDPSFGNPDADR